LPLFKNDWLKWSCEKYAKRQRVNVGVWDQVLGLGFTVFLQFMQRKQEGIQSLPALKP